MYFNGLHNIYYRNIIEYLKTLLFYLKNIFKAIFEGIYLRFSTYLYILNVLKIYHLNMFNNILHFKTLIDKLFYGHLYISGSRFVKSPLFRVLLLLSKMWWVPLKIFDFFWFISDSIFALTIVCCQKIKTNILWFELVNFRI